MNKKTSKMQLVTLHREIISNKAILGKMSLNGEVLAYTLENPWLNNKPFISCVPRGEYKVSKYSSVTYPDVWEIENVEDRTKILIHNGNIKKNTQGCILVGDRWGFLNDELAVLNSIKTLRFLRKVLDDKFIIKIL